MTILKTTFPRPQLLKLDRVSKRFADNIAVDTVSLQLNKGERLALVGPSGCGKTTILRLIAGLDYPDWGAIHLHGKCVSDPSTLVAPHKRNISLVFQDLALWPHMTVAAHIEFALNLKKGGRGREKRDKIDELLTLVRLPRKKAGSYPHQLSGGEKQRLGIARSLALRPQLLLMDEPFSSLDSELKQILMSEVKDLLIQLQITLIYVTHHREEALFMADRVAIMRHGTIKTVSVKQYRQQRTEKSKLQAIMET